MTYDICLQWYKGHVLVFFLLQFFGNPSGRGNFTSTNALMWHFYLCQCHILWTNKTGQSMHWRTIQHPGGLLLLWLWQVHCHLYHKYYTFYFFVEYFEEGSKSIKCEVLKVNGECGWAILIYLVYEFNNGLLAVVNCSNDLPALVLHLRYLSSGTIRFSMKSGLIMLGNFLQLSWRKQVRQKFILLYPLQVDDAIQAFRIALVPSASPSLSYVV